MKFFLFLFLSVCPAEIDIDIDTLHILNSVAPYEDGKVYRVEINNRSESDYLFFISPSQCIDEPAKEKFKQFLRQDVGGGWKMMHIIFEGTMIYNPKHYSKRNLLKKISAKEKFVLLVVNNHDIKKILERIVTIRMSDVKAVLKSDLRSDLLYPYSEAVWPND